jgi:ferredoxin-NADP reductase
MTLHFVRKIKDAEHIYTYYFEPERTLRYIAGQFLEFHIPHLHPDDRGEKRWFTLSSSPTETHLAITTKIDPQKPSSFKRALHALQPGDTIEGSEAMGDFVLPKDESTPLIFIAGGIGITPFRSMITWLAQTGGSRPITLLYLTQSESQIAFSKDLELPYVTVHNLSDGKRRTAKQLSALIGSIGSAHIYISGPEPMAKTLATDFKSMGAHAYQVVTDYFPGYESI